MQAEIDGFVYDDEKATLLSVKEGTGWCDAGLSGDCCAVIDIWFIERLYIQEGRFFWWYQWGRTDFGDGKAQETTIEPITEETAHKYVNQPYHPVDLTEAGKAIFGSALASA